MLEEVWRLGLSVALAAGTGCDPQAIIDHIQDPHPGGGAKDCTPSEDACGPQSFCELPAGSCGAEAGVCEARPDVCAEIYAPVCGCDGKTYGNDCERAAAGVSKRSDGACRDVIEVGEGESCEGFTLPPYRVCQEDLFCMPPPGACNVADVPGTCEVTPTACTKEYDPVCGCDGRTYGNDCERRAAKVALDHPGACTNGGDVGDACGGVAGSRCNGGLFCEYPEGTCQVADRTGVCASTPEVCAQVFDPVCGCDGETYGNDCQRQAAGVAKAHDGAC